MNKIKTQTQKLRTHLFMGKRRKDNKTNIQTYGKTQRTARHQDTRTHGT